MFGAWATSNSDPAKLDGERERERERERESWNRVCTAYAFGNRGGGAPDPLNGPSGDCANKP